MVESRKNHWLGHTDFSEVARGTRLYISEAMWSPTTSRPDYSVGDSLNVAMSNVPEIPATIVAAASRNLTIEIEDGRRFRLEPTPSTALPRGMRSSIPAEDWIVVEEVTAAS